MNLTRAKQQDLYVKTAAAVAGALARKYYGRPHVLARYAIDAAQAIDDVQRTRPNGKRVRS